MQRVRFIEDPVALARSYLVAYVLEFSLALYLLKSFYVLRERALGSRASDEADALHVEPCVCASNSRESRPRRC